jgi:hypothetical protein
MNCPKDNTELKDANIIGYYTCSSCKSVWYIAKVGEIH